MVFPRSFLSLKVLSAFRVNFVVVVTTHKSHDRRIAASFGKREENGFLEVEGKSQEANALFLTPIFLSAIILLYHTGIFSNFFGLAIYQDIIVFILESIPCADTF